MIVLARADGLDREAYDRVVLGGEPVQVAPALLEAVVAARARMLAHLAAGAPAYGVTTGLGRLAGTTIAPERRAVFQRAILQRGAGHGPPLPVAAVRGAMLLRLCGFLAGAAGVSAALCRCLADRLNDGWAPWVPSRGVGGAGEVIALGHLFQTLVGEGWVLEDGVRTPAGVALARRGIAPYVPELKEGIALVDGAPLAPALAAALAGRARALSEYATLAGALAAALAGQSLRPYSPRIGALKGDAGQQRVHARLMELHAGARDWADRPQGPVSFRVLPQVHGAFLDVLDHLDAQVARELRAVTDSPLFLAAEGDEPEGFYPSGNFHAQALSLLLDALAVAAVQLANLSEKRLHRLLDHRFSGLPDQLAAEMPRLARRHELARDDQLGVVEDPGELLRGEQSVRLEVLLSPRRVGRVDARGRREQAVLGGEADRRLVEEHQARLPAGLGGQLVGQAGEAVIEQAVEALLAQVGQLHGRDGERVEQQA